ncbi:hypothetical protein [Luteibacter sp. RCC_6_2]|uniref:hypothetical protein n=1 Tax=Luteibacter sp. RCC_6_2 TaxID=3239223 RepID=UPI0035235CD4
MSQITLDVELPRMAPAILCQKRLDVSVRTRSSRLPWRGQFSPELVEYFLQFLDGETKNIYDPFCGSGTVLYESLSAGHRAFGLEINPAAWHLSVLSRYSKLEDSERELIKSVISSFSIEALDFSENIEDLNIRELISNQNNSFSKLAVAAVFLLAMGNGKKYSTASLTRATQVVFKIFAEIDSAEACADCFLGDARKSPLSDSSIDFVLTSPPYINVFNYHQNYRPAIEYLGWNPLKVAPAEIGANRKNRSNRFLTVIQYCLDIQKSLADIARVLKPGGQLIMVLGKTSNVLGTSFENGQIIKRLLADLGCFEINAQESRSFMNRFGEDIREDVFLATRSNKKISDNNAALDIALDLLKKGLSVVPQKNKYLLDEAIEKSCLVRPSPEAVLDIPLHFS